MTKVMAELSVIILTPDSYETIRKTIHHLRLQSVKDRMEIIIVAPSRDALAADLSELNQFHQHRIVEVGKITSIGSAYAAGVQQASASVVVLAEEHSYPQPGWGEALLAAHDQSFAAVGPVIKNANPNSLVSWADLYIAYGQWLDSNGSGPMEHLPGHNSSYKRDVLMQYGSALDAMMESESVLHWDLCKRGYQLKMEPAAKTLHTNFGQLSAFLVAQFYNGRQFAASRAINESWSLPRKSFYSLASPLIPFVRLWRIVRNLKRARQNKYPVMLVLPALISGLMVDAIGQSLGYSFGAGNATQKMVDFEFHRDLYQKKRAQ